MLFFSCDLWQKLEMQVLKKEKNTSLTAVFNILNEEGKLGLEDEFCRAAVPNILEI